MVALAALLILVALGSGCVLYLLHVARTDEAEWGGWHEFHAFTESLGEAVRRG